MAAHASQALGAPEMAGSSVVPKGPAEKMTAAAGVQVAGGFAARMAAGGRP